jgi:hypothetical protein
MVKLISTKRVRKIVSSIFKKHDIEVYSSKTRMLSYAYDIPADFRVEYYGIWRSVRMVQYNVLSSSNNETLLQATQEIDALLSLCGYTYKPGLHWRWGGYNNTIYNYYAVID